MESLRIVSTLVLVAASPTNASDTTPFAIVAFQA
jgi:hypothetical protein